ncbi:MAG: thioredoxin family protein [Deltaproteobacteria bacterium]|nr:thioredoxin family protein [Deltaproteobacteria bacterium]MBK8234591.1 thioredoxin family protein [Deltaproteobacteria bacterium]MBK8715333.1 thioredoxin family protein [Deltaproteobacteria bacterium]MBP7284964.1 thioredoxin family protein [Nannocystaceae bacterium]
MAAYDELEEPAQIEAIMRPGGGTVVLDFWSQTCGPCLAMADDFAHVAAQFERDEVRFCKVDTGNHGELAEPFHVRAVPTILFIHDGKILDAVVGRMTAKQLGEKAEWLLERAARKPGLLSKLFGGKARDAAS